MGKNIITFKVKEDYKEYNYDGTVLLGELREGEVVEASLYGPTEEYFVIDKAGREVYVAKLNFIEELVFDKDYLELIVGG